MVAAGRRAGPDHRRERHRQGAGGQGPAPLRLRVATARSSPSASPALSPGLVEAELFGHARGAVHRGVERPSRASSNWPNGGTVLLDEVGDIPLNLQVKLLRTIEHREVTPVGDARPRPTDIRLIAATNRPLADLMASGEFREDLFFRLGVFPIHLPPLRDRRDDIPALAEHFLRQARPTPGADVGLSAEVLAELRARPWAGNVRELRNAIEHAAIVARGSPILPEHLPAPSGPAPAAPGSRGLDDEIARWAALAAADPECAPLYERFLDLVEPPLLRAVLDRCQGNRAAAAQALGIHRATLRQKLRRHGIG